MPTLHQVTGFLQYWLNAVDQHSLQSPFVYELYTKVIKKKSGKVAHPEIEKIRDKLMSSTTSIEAQDLGAGSRLSNGRQKQVAEIARHGISKRKYSELLERLIQYLGAKNVVELGTSLGLNTLYLSSEETVQVTTFEGNEALVNMAEVIFEANNRKNVRIVPGNIDQTLPQFLLDCKPLTWSISMPITAMSLPWIIFANV